MDRLTVYNEFGDIELRLVGREGRSLLQVTDIRRGGRVTLDPLELEALTRLSREDLRLLVDPSQTGLAHRIGTMATDELVPGDGDIVIDGIA